MSPNDKGHIAESKSYKLSKYDPIMIFSIDLNTMRIIKWVVVAFLNFCKILDSIRNDVSVHGWKQNILLGCQIHFTFLVPQNFKLLFHIEGILLNIIDNVPLNDFMGLVLKMKNDDGNVIVIIACSYTSEFLSVCYVYVNFLEVAVFAIKKRLFQVQVLNLFGVPKYEIL